MKKLLLLFCFFIGYFVNAQVGIGTPLPNSSSQLDIVANDRGVLITRVSLTSTTDTTTITNGNVESLLVYNTATTSDIVPGYYYWYNNRWNRISVTSDDDNTSNEGFTTDGVDLILTDSNGDFVSIALADLFTETVTSLVNNADGTITYTNEDGILQTLDIATIVQNGETVTTLTNNGDGTFTYTDERGNQTTINKTQITDNGDGTYIIDSGNGTPVTIDTNANALTFDNSTNGFTATNVQGALEEIQLNLDNTTDVLVDNGDGTFTHTAVDGTIVTFDANTTTVTDNGDGTYTITNADGTSAVIDTSAATNPFDNTTSGLVSDNVQGAIDEIVSNIDSGAGVTIVDNADGTVSLIADDGSVLGTVDKTAVADNGDGTFTLDSGNGIPVTIDTNADALAFDNSDNGFTSTNVQDALEEIQLNLDNTTDVLVDNGDGTFTHTAVDGTIVTFDANTTTVTDNGDGTYTITNADGTSAVIDTSAATNPFDNTTSGLASDNVQDAIDEIVSNIDSGAGVTLVDNADGTVSLTADDGSVLGTVDKTAVADNGDGTFTLDSGNGTPVTIDTNADALAFDNSDNGFTSTNVQDALEEIQLNLDNTTDILADNGDGTLTHTAVDGTIVTFDANTTTVTENADGSYTFTDGNGNTITTVETAASTNLFDNNTNGFTSTNVQDALEEIQTNLDNTTDVLVDNLDGTFTHTAVDGTTVIIDANTTMVSVIDGVYTFTDGAGNTVTTIDTNADAITYDGSTSTLTSDNVQDAIDELSQTIATNKGNLTVSEGIEFTGTTDGINKLLSDAGIGIADGGVTTVKLADDAVTSDKVGPDAITNDKLADNAVNTENITDGTISTADLSDGVVSPGKMTPGTINQVMITNAAGDVEWIDNATFVAGNETLTTLVDNTDGTFTYTDESGTPTTINKTAVTDNSDGTFTLDSGNGTPITIDTNADALAFDNSTNGFTSTNVQDALEEIQQNLDNTTDVLVDNGDGTFTHTAVDGTAVIIDANTTTVTENADGSYTFTDGNGNTITTVETAASTNLFDNSTNGFTSTNVQDALEEIQANLDNTTDVLVDNGDGTYTHTAVDGTPIIIDANTTNVSVVEGVYTFTDGAGNTVTTIDTNADALAFDNSTNGFTSTNVQDALEEIQANLDNTTDILVDNGDGTFTHTAVDGTIVTFDANTTTVTENANGSYTFTDGNGNTITTVETAASTNLFDNSTNGFTSTNVQDALEEIQQNLDNTTDVLVDNGDGTFTHTAVDGTIVTFDANTTIVTENTDGSYTFTDGNGNTITTVETAASTNLFDNSTNGFTSTNVQDALEEIQQNLDNTTDVLVDNGDGTFTHTAVDGTAVIIDANTTNVSVVDGVYTFTDGAGNTVTTIDTNAGATAYDNTTSVLVSDNVQEAIDELSQTIETNKGDLTVSEGIEFTGATDGINKLLSNAGIGIADGGVTTVKLADDAVTSDKVGPDAITNDKLADDAVNTENITDGTISTADLSDGAVSPGKMTPGTINQVMITNAAGDVEWIDNAALVAGNETSTSLDLIAGALQYTNEDDTNADVVLISTDTTNVLTTGTDGALLVDSSLSENIYTTDGTLTEFRTVSGTENWLKFEGTDGTIEINGDNLRSANTTGGITNLYYSGDTARLLSQGSSAELQIGTHDTDNAAPITFNTSEGGGHLSDERMRIAGTGEVGIGTVDPTELLDVAGGNVRVRDINTNTGAATDKVVVADTDGVLKTVSGAMPKFFYMPSIVFDVSTTGTFTKDLHQEYIDQFTGTGNPTLVGSTDAPTDIPNLPTATDLYYYVTYYDTTIFSNVSIDANGVLSYTVNSSAVTAGSFMNIVFVVK